MTRESFEQSLETSDVVVPDCDDPLSVPAVKRKAISRSATITGAGFYEPDAAPAMRAFYEAATSGDVCFEIQAPSPDPGWWVGKFLMNTFTTTGDQGPPGYITAEVSFQNDGPWVWIDA